MGNFYVNYTLRGPSQAEVAKCFEGRAAYVTPAQNNYIVAYDEASEDQDLQVISALAGELSKELSCSVLAVLNHDDDVLWYCLFTNGNLADEYNSSPGYFESGEPSAPEGGDANKLCAAFGSTKISDVQAILEKTFEDYTFAVDRHEDLARALGLPNCAVGCGYSQIEEGELPDGLIEDDITRVD
jgi:hypothetical protein